MKLFSKDKKQNKTQKERGTANLTRALALSAVLLFPGLAPAATPTANKKWKDDDSDSVSSQLKNLEGKTLQLDGTINSGGGTITAAKLDEFELQGINDATVSVNFGNSRAMNLSVDGLKLNDMSFKNNVTTAGNLFKLTAKGGDGLGLNLDNVEFSGNTVSGNGELKGGLFNLPKNSAINVDGTVSLKGNTITAKNNGIYGGLFYSTDTLNVAGSGSLDISGNTFSAEIGQWAQGGAFYGATGVSVSLDQNLNLSNNTLTSNGGQAQGGVVYAKCDVSIESNGNISLNNNTLSGIAAAGGAVAVYSSDSDLNVNISAGDAGTLTLNDNELNHSGTYGVSRGSAVYSRNTGGVSNITLSAGTIDVSRNKTNAENGYAFGAVYSYGAKGSSVSITAGNMTFEGNEVTGFSRAYGGAIASGGEIQSETNKSGQLNSNIANRAPGTVELTTTTGSISFLNNKVTTTPNADGKSYGLGGAVFATGDITINSAADIHFSGNSAIGRNDKSSSRGGALFSRSGAIALTANGTISFESSDDGIATDQVNTSDISITAKTLKVAQGVDFYNLNGGYDMTGVKNFVSTASKTADNLSTVTAANVKLGGAQLALQNTDKNAGNFFMTVASNGGNGDQSFNLENYNGGEIFSTEGTTIATANNKNQTLKTTNYYLTYDSKNLTWQGDSGSAAWSADSANNNWQLQYTAGSRTNFETGDTVTFNADGLSNNVTEINVNGVSAGNMTIKDTGANAYTFNGGSLTADSLTADAGQAVFNTNVTVNKDLTLQNGSKLSANNIDAAGTVTVQNASSITVNNDLTSDGSLTTDGSSVTVTGAMSGSSIGMTGGSVEAGSMTSGSVSADGSSVTVNGNMDAGSSLSATNDSGMTIAGTSTVKDGSVNVNGSTFTTGTANFAGSAVTVDNGTLTMTSGSMTAGSATVENGSTISFSANADTSSVNTLDVNNGTLRGGALSANTLTGTGTLTLDNNDLTAISAEINSLAGDSDSSFTVGNGSDAASAAIRTINGTNVNVSSHGSLSLAGDGGFMDSLTLGQGASFTLNGSNYGVSNAFNANGGSSATLTGTLLGGGSATADIADGATVTVNGVGLGKTLLLDNFSQININSGWGYNAGGAPTDGLKITYDSSIADDFFRLDNKLVKEADGANTDLVLNVDYKNVDLVWANKGTNDWTNAKSINTAWHYDSGDNTTYFRGGDSVTFNGRGAGNPNVNVAENISANKLTIASGAYTFDSANGSSVEAKAIHTTGGEGTFNVKTGIADLLEVSNGAKLTMAEAAFAGNATAAGISGEFSGKNITGGSFSVNGTLNLGGGTGTLGGVELNDGGIFNINSLSSYNVSDNFTAHKGSITNISGGAWNSGEGYALGGSETANATIESGAKLSVAGIEGDGTWTLLSDFKGIQQDADGWAKDNLSLVGHSGSENVSVSVVGGSSGGQSLVLNVSGAGNLVNANTDVAVTSGIVGNNVSSAAAAYATEGANLSALGAMGFLPQQPKAERHIWAHGWRSVSRVDGLASSNGPQNSESTVYGVMIGADTTRDNLTLGIAGHLGRASTDGQGSYSGNHSESDFYGLMLYGKLKAGNWDITGDAGYTWYKTDINNSVGGVASGVDAGMLSVGAKASYKIATGGNMSISPFIGLRYNHYTQDSYSFSNGGSNVGSTSYNQYQLPIGVKLEWDNIKTKSGWNLKPSVEFSYIRTMGDLEVNTRVRSKQGADTFNSMSALSDANTLGAQLKFEAKKGNFTSSVNLNGRLSSNQRDWGVGTTFKWEI